jgi:hypothetical protein
MRTASLRSQLEKQYKIIINMYYINNMATTLVLDYKKAAQFANILQIFKTNSESIAFVMRDDYVHIQVMDKSHVCLCESRLYYTWFATGTEPPVGDEATFVVASATIHSIIASLTTEQQRCQIQFDPQADTFTIDILHAVTNKENIDKHYTLPLIGTETQMINVVDGEYVAEFTIGVKTLADVLAQMTLFGAAVRFHCNEETVQIASTGDKQKGALEVAINTADFEEFAIDEAADIAPVFSLTHLTKMCITTKLVAEVKVFISDERPMKILYLLGGGGGDAATDTESIVQFLLAPKIGDDDDD